MIVVTEMKLANFRADIWTMYKSNELDEASERSFERIRNVEGQMCLRKMRTRRKKMRKCMEEKNRYRDVFFSLNNFLI